MAGVNLDRQSMTAVHGDQDLYDLLKITTDHYPNEHKLDVLFERHDWPVMNEWFKNHREQFVSGTEVTETVMLDGNGNAKFVEPYETDEATIPNRMAILSMPFKLAQVGWVTEKTELLRNRAPDKMIDLVEKKRAEADFSMANLLEQRGFRCPNSTNDKKNPYGVPYYLVPITATQVAAATYGHQGANPNFQSAYPGGADSSGSSLTYTAGNCLGIDASDDDYALWRSYNDYWAHNTSASTLADFDDDDVAKITRMYRRLRFKGPMNAAGFGSGAKANFAGYTTEGMIETMEKLARRNNDSLGADLGMYAGNVVVKGVAIQWAEEMDNWVNDDNAASHTLVFLNHDYFMPYCMEGDYFAESGPFRDDDRNRVAKYFIGLQFNFWCPNRRYCGGRIDAQPAAST